MIATLRLENETCPWIRDGDPFGYFFVGDGSGGGAGCEVRDGGTHLAFHPTVCELEAELCVPCVPPVVHQALPEMARRGVAQGTGKTKLAHP